MILLPLNETMDARPKLPAARPGVGGPQRFRGIRHDRHTELVGDREDRGVVDGLAEQVDRDDRRHGLAGVAQLDECLTQQRRIHVPGRGIGVDEVRLGTGVDDGVGRRSEGHRRGEHHVARLHAPP